jgi:hypothetical protein
MVSGLGVANCLLASEPLFVTLGPVRHLMDLLSY